MRVNVFMSDPRDEEQKWLQWMETQFQKIAGEDGEISLEEFKTALGVKRVRERERERNTERDRDREKDRERQRETERKRQRERDRQRVTEREREIVTERERELREICRNRPKDRHTDKQTDRELMK